MAESVWIDMGQSVALAENSSAKCSRCPGAWAFRCPERIESPGLDSTPPSATAHHSATPGIGVAASLPQAAG